jgi:hypothetical protein
MWDVGVPPLGAHLLRRVEDVAEPEHGASAGLANRRDRRDELAASAERVLVDEDHRWLERLHGRLEQRVAHVDDPGAADVEATAGVLLVGDLAQAGQLDDVDARRDPEAVDLVCARGEEDGRPRRRDRERGCDREVATGMAEAEPVVRIHEKPFRPFRVQGTHSEARCA